MDPVWAKAVEPRHTLGSPKPTTAARRPHSSALTECERAPALALSRVYGAGIQLAQFITGAVVVRQMVYNAEHHGIEVSSNAQRVETSTVDANPGQYLNSTLQ